LNVIFKELVSGAKVILLINKISGPYWIPAPSKSISPPHPLSSSDQRRRRGVRGAGGALDFDEKWLFGVQICAGN